MSEREDDTKLMARDEKIKRAAKLSDYDKAALLSSGEEEEEEEEEEEKRHYTGNIIFHTIP